MTLILNLISHTGWMGSIDLHISRRRIRRLKQPHLAKMRI